MHSIGRFLGGVMPTHLWYFLPLGYAIMQLESNFLPFFGKINTLHIAKALVKGIPT